MEGKLWRLCDILYNWRRYCFCPEADGEQQTVLLRLRIAPFPFSRFLMNQKFHIIQIDMVYGKIESVPGGFAIDGMLFLLYFRGNTDCFSQITGGMI